MLPQASPDHARTLDGTDASTKQAKPAEIDTLALLDIMGLPWIGDSVGRMAAGYRRRHTLISTAVEVGSIW